MVFMGGRGNGSLGNFGRPKETSLIVKIANQSERVPRLEALEKPGLHLGMGQKKVIEPIRKTREKGSQPDIRRLVFLDRPSFDF